MLLLGQLAKIQGLKGEFLFHAIMDDPDRLPDIQGLVLAPPELDPPARRARGPGPSGQAARLPLAPGASPAWPSRMSRTAPPPKHSRAGPYGCPEDQASLEDGETFRHGLDSDARFWWVTRSWAR